MAGYWDDFGKAPAAPSSEGGYWAGFDKNEPGDTMRGIKRSFVQVPEFAYGAGALAAMSAEKLFGEGGLSTTAKDYFAEKYVAKQAENQKYAPSVEFTDAWENLKAGDVGSMADWLQDTAGYVVGQGLQTLVTGGIGALAGKAALAGATEKMLGSYVANQAAKIAEASAGKIAMAEATKLAAQRTAQAIGAGLVLSAQNTGMEAGDIYGGLMDQAEKTGEPITGDDLLRAWGMAAAAAGTETATDLLGLGAVTGRLKIGGKAMQEMTGAGGRAARGATAAAIGMPVEAGQEYAQTYLEQVGAGQPTDTPEAQRERVNAAAVGAVGGAVMGGGIGLISGARPPTPSGEPIPTTPEAIAGEVMAQTTLEGAIAKTAEITGLIGSDIASAIDKETISDRQNVQGLPSQVGEGQEPVQAGAEQGRGAEAVAAGRVLQAPGPDRQVIPAINPAVLAGNPPIISDETPTIPGKSPAVSENGPEITMAEVEKVRNIPTVETMREAIAVVGDDEFQRQAQAKIAKYKPTTPDQEAMLVEATAVEIVVKQRRESAQNAPGEALPAPATTIPAPAVAPQEAAKAQPPAVSSTKVGDQLETRSFAELARLSDGVQTKIDDLHDELEKKGIPFDEQNKMPEVEALYAERIKYDAAAAQKGYVGARSVVEKVLSGMPQKTVGASVDSILRERYSLTADPGGVYMMSKYTGKAIDSPKTLDGLARDIGHLIVARDYQNADYDLLMESNMSALTSKGKAAIIREAAEKAKAINEGLRDFFTADAKTAETPSLETKTPPDLLQKAGTIPVIAQKSGQNRSAATITAPKQNVGTSPQLQTDQNIPKTGPIAPKLGSQIPTERPAGKILGADVRALSDAHIAKFSKSKNKRVSDLALADQAWRAAQVKPTELPKYGKDADARKRLIRQAAEKGMPLDERVEAAIAKVNGGYTLAATAEAIQYGRGDPIVNIEAGNPIATLRYFVSRTDKRDRGYAARAKDILAAMGEPAESPKPAAPVAEAAHVEDGKIEEVTGEVIRESVAEGAANTKLTLSQQREYMLAELDKAIAKAKTMGEAAVMLDKNGALIPQNRYASLATLEKSGLPMRRQGEGAGRIDFAKAPGIGYVTIDVPGDGVFRVVNIKERLQVLRRQASAAFKRGPKPPTAEGPAEYTKTPKGSSAELARLQAENAKEFPAESTPEPVISATAEKPMTPADHLEAAAKLMREAEKAKVAEPEKPSGDTDATLARFRPKQMVVFSKPYVGKTGAKLTGYEWKWTKEEIVDNRGEDRVIRVSDWEEAITNPETNRDIVHQFQIEKTDGELVLVSAETAAKLLGVSESTARSSAKRLLENEIEAQNRAGALDRYLNGLDKREWHATPAAAINALGGALQRIWSKYRAWGDHLGKDDSYNYTQTRIDFTRGPKGYLALEAATDEPRGWKGVQLTPPEIWDKNGNDKPAQPNPEARLASPVAESQAPGSKAVAPGPGDAGVAPRQEGGTPEQAIDDFGEKIGGARKDTAQPIGKRAQADAEESAEPGWRKRFSASQIAASAKEGEVGQWVIHDARTKDWRGQPKQIGQTFASKESAEKAIPLLAVAQKHRVVPVGKPENGIQPYEIWRDVTERKRVKVVDQQFATREDAMRYMAEHAVEIIETKTAFGEEILAKPDKVKRTGVARRTGPATPQMFTDTFGFRGVEFGLWNNQDERQDVMNHAYDGLLDLADVLNVPAKALSLNGDLALAFGARGQGLSGAKAHYEADYGVINLTKMTGAGSLAHEWLHAADHYLARQDTKAKSEKIKNARGDMVYPAGTPSGDMASHGFTKGYKVERNAEGALAATEESRSGVRAELRAAYDDLIQTMFTKAEQYVEDTQKSERFVGKARESLAEAINQIRVGLTRGPKELTYMKRNNNPASAEQLATFDQLADKLLAGQDLDTKFVSKAPANTPAHKRGGLAGRWSNDTLEAMSAILKTVRGRQGFNAEHSGPLDGLRYLMKNYRERIKMLESANANESKTKRVPTSYAMENKRIDQGRASDYWTTPHEMAARAFSAYVEDKIGEQGNQSDFLAYGSDNRFYAFLGIRPFPEGAERVAINQAFDKFFDELKTRETDKGVEMYSQTAEPGPGLPAADIRAHIAKITDRLSVAVPVYDSVEQARLAGFSIASDAQGFAKGEQLGLVTENIKTLLQAETTLFHELWHVGIKRVTSDPNVVKAHNNYNAALNRVAMANPEVRRRVAAWREKYGKDKRKQFEAVGVKGPELELRVRLQSFDEAIAEMAGERRGKPVTRLNELIAALQRLVRALGFDELASWMEGKTDAEVLSLIRAATQAVSKGTVAFGGELAGNGVSLSQDDGGKYGSRAFWDHILRQSERGGSGYSRVLSVEGFASAIEAKDRRTNSRGAPVILGEDDARERGTPQALRVAYWPGKLAGQEGHYSVADVINGHFVVSFIPESLAPNENDYAEFHSASTQGDASILRVAFIRTTVDGTYELSVSDPQRGSAAFNLLRDQERIEPTGKADSKGVEYFRVKFDSKPSDILSLLTESVRRLAINDGAVPTIIRPTRDTGANPRGARLYTKQNVIESYARPDQTQTDPDIMHVRAGSPEAAITAPDWVQVQPADMQETLRKAGAWRPKQTLQDRFAGWTENWQAKLRQGMVDQFDPIKAMDYHAYMLARMTKSAAGPLEAALFDGTVFLDKDGAVDLNYEKGGFIGRMQALKGEHDRFFSWVIGNRAARLMEKGKEHNFTKDDIVRLKTLNQGDMADGSHRNAVYLKALSDLNRYNKSILDMAEKAGLVNGESRPYWEHDFYIPFYRMTEGDTTKGPVKQGGLVRQYAFKTLKGGAEAIGDPMENILKNWAHLIDASLKNQAAVASLDAAEKIMGADGLPVASVTTPDTKGAIFVMKNGEKTYYTVNDPFILDAINSLGFSGFTGPAMKTMSSFKRWLTFGVTISPAFRIRNVIRDSISMIGVNPASYNVLDNVLTGWKLTAEDSPAYASMIAGGGVIRFGTLETESAANIKRLVDSGVDANTVLDSPAKVKAMLKTAYDWWMRMGDRSENMNRAALYQKLRDEGRSHLEASYAARDTMDFSMSGTWSAIRFLAQTVPFLNARLQGMYKLGRGAAEDPRRFSYVVGGAALASIALLLAYQDDDDWKQREDFDRETYWWFKIGDTAFRIPKPFEIGALATVAERGLEAMITDDLTGKQFVKRIGSVVGQQLSMNPVPQLFMPMIETWANRDAFTGRPIESMGMDRLSPAERISPYTSAFAQLVGKNGVVSPVQIDHLINGYFGWLGTHAVATADLALRPTMGLPEKPAMRIDDVFTIGDFARSMPAYQSKYVTHLYEQGKEVQEAMADLRAAQKIGATEKAAEILKDRGDKIRLYRLYTHAEKQLTQINSQIKRVQLREGDADVKRERLDQLYVQRNRIAKITGERAQATR